MLIRILFFSQLLLLSAMFPSQIAAKPELPPSDEKPTPEESKAREALASRFTDLIIFDSNRGNGFGLYTTDATGNVQTFLDHDRHEMYAEVSPDGNSVVYGSVASLARNSPAQVWIVSADGTGARMLSDNGDFPAFSSDGKAVYFSRNRKLVIRYELDTGVETEIFPAGHEVWSRMDIVIPRVSPDGTQVAFTSRHPRQWSSWYVDLATGASQHIGPGCEPTWSSDGEKLLWINGALALERSGVFAFDKKTGQVSPFQDEDAPRGHEYFPTLSNDNRYLFFASSRPKEHSPITANYQLYVKELETGTVTRITFDPYTNRWPKLFPRKTAKQPTE